MIEKFTLEDLLMKIMPGGVLIGILYFLFAPQLGLEIKQGLDFFYTFIFFAFSYVAGEVIQTISHELERAIFLFFKFYKPSEIFVYRNNPVLGNEHIRQELFAYLGLDLPEKKDFDRTYKELPFVWWKRTKQSKSQSIFWKLYSNVSSDPEMRIFNSGYLFVRAITFLSLGIALLFLIKGYLILSAITLALFVLFFWRARGMARMLVFKTVILNLRSKKL